MYNKAEDFNAYVGGSFMKPSRIILIFLLTIFIVSSCRKNKDPLFDGVTCLNNCYILTGKLIDSAANTGIDKGEIKFFFKDITGTFSSKNIYLGKAITDANGIYTFKFSGSNFNNVMGYYFAEAYKGDMFADPMYRNRVATFDLDSSDYNSPFLQHFLLFRPATVKVRIIATSVTNFQYLTISYGYGKIGSGIVLNGGRAIDTTFTWRTAGDLRTFIKCAATGNGVNIEKRDTLIIPRNSTRQIEIRL